MFTKIFKWIYNQKLKSRKTQLKMQTYFAGQIMYEMMKDKKVVGQEMSEAMEEIYLYSNMMYVEMLKKCEWL